jgi:predicted amidophosphoribosyltransferase
MTAERWVCQAPICEACRRRTATFGSLCDECAATIDAAYERLRDEVDLYGDPECE